MVIRGCARGYHSMYNGIKMYELPLFPLHTVLFPGIPIQLHIFEARYKLMVRHCLDRDQPFGVALIHQGAEALGPPADPFKTGCTAHIVEVEPLEEGRMNLTAVGEERFRILSLHTGLPYLVGQVESFPLENHHTLDMLRGQDSLADWVQRYLRLLSKTGEQALDLAGMELPDEPVPLMYLAASLLQLPAIEKQPLLEAKSIGWLYHEIIRLYRRETAVLQSHLAVEEERATRASWLN